VGDRLSTLPKEAAVKYVILIYSNPRSRDMWASFSKQDKREGLAYYAKLVDDLQGSGELVVTEALADPSLTKRVTAGEGGTVTSDGPYAEAKELLAGFFLVDCESAERAVEIAGRVPEASMGLVEVRPVMALSDFEV
jgi:hypothetical protein